MAALAKAISIEAQKAFGFGGVGEVGLLAAQSAEHQKMPQAEVLRPRATQSRLPSLRKTRWIRGMTKLMTVLIQQKRQNHCVLYYVHPSAASFSKILAGNA